MMSGEVLPVLFQEKVAEVKLSQNPRNRLLQSAGVGKQEKGTKDCSTELQESERYALAECLAKERGM